MELDQLRGFVETAKELSFTRAARKLFLTQPAVSLQVKALESEYGQLLFERQGKRILLTQAGQLLLDHGEEILARVDRVGEALASQAGLHSGHLKVAASDTICAYVLPPVVRDFRDQFPGVEIGLTDRMSPDVARLVAEGGVDIGLATMPVRTPGVEAEVLYLRKDVAICSAQHDLAGRSRVSVARLGEEPMLMLSPRSTTRALVDQFFADAGVTCRIAMELESIEVIKRYVEIGLGVSIVPRAAVRTEVADGRLGLVKATGIPGREVAIVRRPGQASPVVEAFLAVVRARFAGKPDA